MKRFFLPISLLAVVILTAVFWKYKTLTSISLIPIAIAALAAVMSIMYNFKHDDEMLDYQANKTGLTDEEKKQYEIIFSNCIIVCVPIELALALFFGTAVKIVAGISAFLGAIILANLIFSIKHHKNISARMDNTDSASQEVEAQTNDEE